MSRWPVHLLALLCALASARCSMCSGPGPGGAARGAKATRPGNGPTLAPKKQKIKDKKMVEQTTYPVFLANTLRNSAVTAASRSAGAVVWSRPHGLPKNDLPRYLLLWQGRVLAESPRRLLLLSHEGKRLWERAKQQGAFAAVAGDELLHHQNTRQRLDVVDVHNAVKQDNIELPPAGDDEFELSFYAPHGKGRLLVAQVDTGSTMQVHTRKQDHGEMYSVWERDIDGQLSLPPIYDAAARQVLFTTSLKVRRVSVRNGKEDAGWELTIYQPQNWSADGRGNLYVTGLHMTEAGQKRSVLLALTLAGKELWRWSGSPKLASWSPRQPPIVGTDGRIHAFSAQAVLTFKEGKLVWDYKAAPTYGTALPDGSLLVTTGNNLVRLDRDGDRLFTVALGNPALTPPVVDGNGDVYVATTTNLVKIQ